MGTFVKLGGHFRFGQTAAGQLWAANGASLKALDDPSYLDQAPGGQVTVFRHYAGDGDGQYQQIPPATFLAAVESGLAGRRPTFIEGPNECGYDDVVGFTAWMAEYVSLAHAAGYAVAGFSYGVGWPTQSDLLYIAGHGFAGVDAFAIHEYWSTYPPFDAFTALRHQTMNGWLAAAGYGAHPHWIVTECGRASGWQWSGYGLSAQAFVAELQAYDAAIAGDSTVVAAHLYTHGGCGGSPSFCDFEIDPLAAVLWPTGGGGGGGCTDDATCQAQLGPGYVCRNGVCVSVGQPPPGCTDAICQARWGPGYVCLNGECVSVVKPSPGLSVASLVGAILAGVAIAGGVWFIVQEREGAAGGTAVAGAPVLVTTLARPSPPGPPPPGLAAMQRASLAAGAGLRDVSTRLAALRLEGA